MSFLFQERIVLKISNVLEVQLVTLQCVGLGSWISDIFVPFQVLSSGLCS